MKWYKDNLGIAHVDNSNEDTWEEITEKEANDCYTLIEYNEIQEAITTGEMLIEKYIQSYINTYNSNNGVKFNNVHNCANYKDELGYTHQVFCLKVWNFNIQVWEAGRLIQSDIISGNSPIPTKEEFKMMLPKWID